MLRTRNVYKIMGPKHMITNIMGNENLLQTYLRIFIDEGFGYN